MGSLGTIKVSFLFRLSDSTVLSELKKRQIRRSEVENFKINRGTLRIAMTGSVKPVKRKPLVNFMIYETEAISLDHICHRF